MKRASRKRSVRRAKKNYYGAGVLAAVNPRRRRRRAVANPHRRRRTRLVARSHRLNPRRHRRARHNPPMGGKLFGFSLPPIDAVLFVGAGLVVPPLVSAQIMKYLPDSLKTNQAATWGVKAAAVLVPGFLIRKFYNPRAGNLFMVGGAASLVVDAIKTFMPGVIPGLGYQPMLGGYFNTNRGGRVVPLRTAVNGGTPQLVADAPDRLDPRGRF